MHCACACALPAAPLALRYIPQARLRAAVAAMAELQRRSAQQPLESPVLACLQVFSQFDLLERWVARACGSPYAQPPFLCAPAASRLPASPLQ